MRFPGDGIDQCGIHERGVDPLVVFVVRSNAVGLETCFHQRRRHLSRRLCAHGGFAVIITFHRTLGLG